MIICADFCGQLGNHLLTFNNLIQLTELLKVKFVFRSFYIDRLFDIRLKNYPDYNNINSKLTINSRNLVRIFGDKPNLSREMLIRISRMSNIHIKQPFLGELFFRYNVVNPNKFIKLKPVYSLENRMRDDVINIGIHIRDMGAWNKRHEGVSDLKPSYYINAIKHCLRNREELYDEASNKTKLLFILIGATSNKQSSLGEKCDVSNYPPYIETEKYLTENDVVYEYGITTQHPNRSYIYDWSQLSQCDVIISSAGTFALSAGIFGKENKKIIHSKEWVEYAANKYDTFWKDLYDGGNKHYKLWKLI